MNEGCFLCHFFLYPNFPAKPPILLYLYNKHVLLYKGKISLLFSETYDAYMMISSQCLFLIFTIWTWS